MSTQSLSGADAILRWLAAGLDERSESYAGLIGELQGFLHAFAAADLSEAEMHEMRDRLASMRATAETSRVAEVERRFGRGRRQHTGVHAMMPEIETHALDDEHFLGTTIIGDFYLGVNSAAHGGVVALIFDEVLGRLSAGLDRPPSRTAYLKTDFRSITPVNVPLTVRARVEQIEGRKRFLVGEVWHGEVLCAEAHALFVELKPGQP